VFLFFFVLHFVYMGLLTTNKFTTAFFITYVIVSATCYVYM